MDSQAWTWRQEEQVEEDKMEKNLFKNGRSLCVWKAHYGWRLRNAVVSHV
jgi:hypothetical protein